MYKPWGMTPYGARKRHEQRIESLRLLLVAGLAIEGTQARVRVYGLCGSRYSGPLSSAKPSRLQVEIVRVLSAAPL